MIKLENLLVVFFLMCSLSLPAQILVNGKASNEIYSYADNVVTFMSTRVCTGMNAQVDDKTYTLSDRCSFDLDVLRSEKSAIAIIDEDGKTLFESELVRNPNLPTAYLSIHGKDHLAGNITLDDIEKLEEMRIDFPCPWMKDTKIYSFTLMVQDAADNFLHYDISGSGISQEIRDEISQLTEKTKLIITDIQFDANKYLHSVNSIALDIE